MKNFKILMCFAILLAGFARLDISGITFNSLAAQTESNANPSKDEKGTSVDQKSGSTDGESTGDSEEFDDSSQDASPYPEQEMSPFPPGDDNSDKSN